MGKKLTRMIMLCGLLAALLSATAWAVLPSATLAAEPRIIQRGECGGNLTWTLDDAGLLTISGTGDMEEYRNTVTMNYEPDGTTAPWGQYQVSSVFVNPGATSISNFAFTGLTVQSVSLPNTVDSIGDYAFCRTKLVELNLPDSVVHIYGDAFKGCESLTKVTLSKNLEEIGNYAFQNCSSLKNVAILGDTSVIGEYAFKNCFRLQYLTLPISLKEVKTSAFDGCSRLSDIFYPGNQDEWGKITIGDDNYNLIYAKNYRFEFPLAAKLITLDETDFTLAISESKTLTPSFFPAGIADEPLRWSSSNSDIAEVTDGEVLAKSIGTVTITAETLDFRLSTSCTLAVTGHGPDGTFHVNWLKPRDEDGSELDSIPEGFFYATISVTNESSADTPPIFLTSYSSDGTFLGFMWVEVKASLNATVEVTFPVDNYDGEIAQLKAFAVSSFDGLMPLDRAVSFPEEE